MIAYFKLVVLYSLFCVVLWIYIYRNSHLYKKQTYSGKKSFCQICPVLSPFFICIDKEEKATDQNGQSKHSRDRSSLFKYVFPAQQHRFAVLPRYAL